MTDAAALEIILNALPVRAPHRFLDRAVVVRSGRQTGTRLSDAATLPLRWKIVSDLRVIAEGEAHDRTLGWPADLPPGSYRLHLTDASLLSEEVPYLVAPQKAFGGDFDRSWILAVQLYGVRSARNWGMGDFTDLEGLIELAAASERVASVSIRCTRCSTTGLTTAAPIHRTAGCSSMRSISTSKNFPNLQLPALIAATCFPARDRANSSTIAPLPS